MDLKYSGIDSEMVKEIKTSGILTEEDIIENEKVIITPGSMGINCDTIKDFTYKNAYIKKRDFINKTSLIDGQEIKFILGNQNITFNYNDYTNQPEKIKRVSLINQYKGTHNSEMNHNEYLQNKDKINDIESEESDNNCLYYEQFIKNNHSIQGLNLLYENEIILKSSYINILYNYPCYTPKTTFHISADNEMEGFTFGELALKAMQFYHLLFDLYKHYDIQKGIRKELPDNDRERYFRSVAYIGEWEDNGLHSLKYHKETDTWEFICIEYI